MYVAKLSKAIANNIDGYHLSATLLHQERPSL